ncbi:glycosyltransferase family 2 protein [Elizabethkingia meningoseptica]|uniref:glycosyltransferase family 2 protein n=1 Tax=Elizabethkingia meningoseptica TaxID=238 RepID=UPI0008422F1E|nr:glycosyltransferase family 2 protein [Elizabethkingia meningoseptica]ODM54982.1 hypothetical protein BES09_00525 [Elizabethkingia meningoseptica]OHT30188.1 hypothetical protein BFF93_00530 [Elizabethkingia meningoseptica]OPC11861.1 hypothetical protein BAX93_04985 [Elizabethkingia meningoseptica]
METIDILMATYNGEKYIESQILSLLAQTHKNWMLFIHDDGSVDNTIDIIRKYEKLDTRIILIQDNIKFGNAGANFLHLLNFSDSKYIVFCDQDDIWLEAKLELLYNKIKNKTEPLAVYCNAFGYNGNTITTNKVSLIERENLSDSLFLNSGVQGSSLMFNEELKKQIIDFPNYIYMHDHYVTMFAITFANLLYVDKSLMLYRQHSLNVTGNVPITIFDRIRSFFNKENPIIDNNHYKANQSFYDKFKNKMTKNQRELFEAYLEFPKKGFFSKILSVFKNDFRVGNTKFILLIKLFVKKTI